MNNTRRKIKKSKSKGKNSKSRRMSKKTSKRSIKKSYMVPRKSSLSDDIIPEEKFVEQSPTGRYLRFREILGQGSSKTVYKAIDTSLMREIAWNTIDVKNKTKDEKRRIVEEIELLNNMNNPYIMKFYGSWAVKDSENKIFKINFMTEMSSSGSLKEFLYKYRFFKIEHIKNWCTQILEALNYLHSQGIIHRDLKCENIFIHGDTSQIFIGDFGLSTRKELGKSAVGTPEYMAPELYESNPYNDKIDMYAFGMCMLEMCTLEPPYNECTSIPQIYRKVTSGILPESLDRVKDENMRQMISKLLSSDPNNRPSAAQLLSSNFFKKIDERKIPDEKL